MVWIAVRLMVPTAHKAVGRQSPPWQAENTTLLIAASAYQSCANAVFGIYTPCTTMHLMPHRFSQSDNLPKACQRGMKTVDIARCSCGTPRGGGWGDSAAPAEVRTGSPVQKYPPRRTVVLEGKVPVCSASEPPQCAALSVALDLAGAFVGAGTSSLAFSSMICSSFGPGFSPLGSTPSSLFSRMYWSISRQPS